MANSELNAMAHNYFHLLTQIEELQAQAEAIKDSFKAVMVERTTENLKGDGWSATWHNTTTNRFDSSAFKKEHGDMYKAFCKPVCGTRFTLTAVKA